MHESLLRGSPVEAAVLRWPAVICRAASLASCAVHYRCCLGFLFFLLILDAVLGVIIAALRCISERNLPVVSVSGAVN